MTIIVLPFTVDGDVQVIEVNCEDKIPMLLGDRNKAPSAEDLLPVPSNMQYEHEVYALGLFTFDDEYRGLRDESGAVTELNDASKRITMQLGSTYCHTWRKGSVLIKLTVGTDYRNHYSTPDVIYNVEVKDALSDVFYFGSRFNEERMNGSLMPLRYTDDIRTLVALESRLDKSIGGKTAVHDAYLAYLHEVH